MTTIRIIIGAILSLIVTVALVPMGVLLDLAAGGDGFGICEGGTLGSCVTSYFDGIELLGGLTILIFLLLMLLRMAMHAQRMLDDRERHRAAMGAVTGVHRLRQG
ncbi:MAG TPA: hypothetical protein VLD62_11630 [Acidimicrobiia bacterium]|nr:hypothetical protein [Acidimicrobiia bacterium]